MYKLVTFFSFNSMLHFLWPILDLHPSQLQLRNKIDFLLTCGFAVVSNKPNWTVAIVTLITLIVMIGTVTYATILASRNASLLQVSSSGVSPVKKL